MMNGLLGLIFGCIFTLIIGVTFLNATNSLHKWHVRQYYECVKLGAPVQNCIDAYFLDKTP